MVVLEKAQDECVALDEEKFNEYIERSTENTTVNGVTVVKDFSWYKKVMGLF